MDSKIAEALRLENHPVALTWADAFPIGAAHFVPGRWACVMSMIAAVATDGRTAAFDRDTYGCWGGGVGLGFGNCYETFPGGVDGFCRFLSDGNEKSEAGREMGLCVSSWGRRDFAADYKQGERYLKDPATAARFVDSMPMCDIPAKCVIFTPLEKIESADDSLQSVTLFVTADQLSALIVLANYTDPDFENVLVPWAAACQVIGIFGYRENGSAHPRGLVGLSDLSARLNARGVLGANMMSFTMPWPLFVKMEENVAGSFLDRPTWKELQKR